MIKFFRKIRQNLLNEGKTSKYFKYAIGEIVLVVIGILIALQINNWNENNNKNKIKASYITSLIVDYKKDTLQLNEGLAYNTSQLKSIDSIYQTLSLENVQLEDFLHIFNSFDRNIRTQTIFNTNSYNVLVSSGSIDILDKELIENLMELNRLQNDFAKIIDRNGTTYVEMLANSALEFPIINYMPMSESSNDLIWKKVDAERVPNVIINILGFKKYNILRYLQLSKEISQKTKEVLVILKSRQND
jgi:hypothetical protein